MKTSDVPDINILKCLTKTNAQLYAFAIIALWTDEWNIQILSKCLQWLSRATKNLLYDSAFVFLNKLTSTPAITFAKYTLQQVSWWLDMNGKVSHFTNRSNVCSKAYPSQQRKKPTKLDNSFQWYFTADRLVPNTKGQKCGKWIHVQLFVANTLLFLIRINKTVQW